MAGMWSSLPLVSDPFFYAVAVPAVVLLGISKSGFGAGFGALAVPLMALAIPVPQAAAILMPLLFYRFALWGMFLTGCKLLWDGFQ